MKEEIMPPVDCRRMYSDLAWLFPLISPPDEYTYEATELWETIKHHAKLQPKTLLDLGSGAGHLDYHLKKHLNITAVDCSDKMVEIARQLNPEVKYHVNDMRRIRLGIQYDVVLIADSLIYMLSEDDLRSAFKTAFEHLAPNGIFLTYLDAFRDHPRENEVRHSTYYYDNLVVTHIEHYFDPDPSDTTYEMIFINIIRANGKFNIELDHHLGGIFDLELYSRLLREVGFHVIKSFLRVQSVPMFVCKKNSSFKKK